MNRTAVAAAVVWTSLRAASAMEIAARWLILQGDRAANAASIDSSTASFRGGWSNADCKVVGFHRARGTGADIGVEEGDSKTSSISHTVVGGLR